MSWASCIGRENLTLKDKQREALIHLYDGRDVCLCMVPYWIWQVVVLSTATVHVLLQTISAHQLFYLRLLSVCHCSEYSHADAGPLFRLFLYSVLRTLTTIYGTFYDSFINFSHACGLKAMQCVPSPLFPISSIKKKDGLGTRLQQRTATYTTYKYTNTCTLVK